MKRSLSVSAAILSTILASIARADDQTVLELARKGPHIGPATDAVVGIEVVDEPAVFSADGSRVVGARGAIRRCSGLLVRCDGFIIAPSAVFGSPKRTADPRRKVRVTVFPGTERSRRIVTSAPLQVVPGVGYAVVKLDEFHAPAARLRQPDGMNAGELVFAYWTPWDEASGQFGAPARASIQLGEVAATVAPMGSVKVARPLDPAASGACIATPDGVAVGIGPMSGGTVCSTFAAFSLASNCVVPSVGKVGPVPAADAPPAGDGTAKTSSDTLAGSPMVSIPGGPVILPQYISQEQPDMNGASWGCVASFEVDKYEVTNNEYLDFWNSLPESARKKPEIREAYFPLGWAPTGEPFPAKLGTHPVLGVTYSGAESYARSKGKRLPTPYEWCLAALGPSGDTKMPRWAQEFIASCNVTWDSLLKAHVARMVPPILANVDDESRYLASEQRVFPWFYWAPSRLALQESTWSRDQVMAAFLSLMDQWKRPKHTIAVGSRAYDISPYGVMDAVLNAAEIVTPYPSGRADRPATVYVNVDWQYTPYFGTKEWIPITPKGRWWGSLWNPWTYTNNPPLLSRHVGFSGKLQTPPGYFRSLIVDSTFYEISDLVRPIDTWRVTYIKEQTSRWVFSTVLNDAVGQNSIAIDQAVSYPVWAGVPRWFEQEMGRSIAFPDDALTERLGQVIQGSFSSDREERWLAPGGFRCIR